MSLKTEHFLVLGDASPRQIRDVALRFEQFRSAVTSTFPPLADNRPGPPVVVIVFRDQRAYEPYQPKFDGRTVKVGGYFLGARDVNYITLTANTGRDDFETVYHEYTHLLLQRLAANLSPWFNEGLADYFSTFEVAGASAKFGLPIERHLDLLSHGRMPLSELFAVTTQSKTYNEGNRRSLFYAQSWLLVHYALVEKRDRWNQLVAFETLVENGAPVESAFQRAFGVGPDVLEKELTQYSQQATMRFYPVQLDQRVAARIESEPMRVPEAEAQARLGDLLAHAGRSDEATALLEASLKGAPELPFAHAALGKLLLSQNQSEIAMAHLESAAAAHAADEFVQFYYGAALMEHVDGGAATDGNLAKAISALEQAVRLRSGFTDAERMLGYGYLVADQPAKARDSLAGVLQQEPGDHKVTLMLAEALVRLGQFNEARNLLGPLVGRADPDVKERARNLLGRSATIEQQQQLRAEAAATAADTPSATQPAMPPTQLPVAPPQRRPGNFQPALRAVNTGETRSFGLFTQIDCARGLIVLHVSTPGGTLLLRAPGFDAIDFISYRSSTPGTVSCGVRPQPEDVYVTWRAEQASISIGMSQGIAVAVELLPDGFVPSR